MCILYEVGYNELLEVFQEIQRKKTSSLIILKKICLHSCQLKYLVIVYFHRNWTWTSFLTFYFSIQLESHDFNFGYLYGLHLATPCITETGIQNRSRFHLLIFLVIFIVSFSSGRIQPPCCSMLLTFTRKSSKFQKSKSHLLVLANFKDHISVISAELSSFLAAKISVLLLDFLYV